MNDSDQEREDVFLWDTTGTTGTFLISLHPMERNPGANVSFPYTTQTPVISTAVILTL
jgi:hypothetical protein